MKLICVIFLLVGLTSALPLPKGGANQNQPEVQKLLGEIRDLLLKHYKVPAMKKPAPTEEQLKEANLLDDIKFTLPQAQRLLASMKRRWGYDAPSERIVPDPSMFWEMPIKYAFNGQHSEEHRNIIRAGFKMWEDTTCVKMEEHANATELEGSPHLLIVKESGCWSYIGVTFPEGQELSIGPGCERLGTVAHELGHALGLAHEFSRPDRDEHVSVIWENILDGKEYNFFIEEDWDPAKTGYDITSIMHYDSLGFSIDQDKKARVMMPHNVHQLTAMGQRARLQFNDIKRVNVAYDCIGKMCRPDQLRVPSCKNGGYQDPKNCAICRCPPGLAGDDCASVAEASGPDMKGCGGDIFLEQCHIRSLTIPTWPKPYGEETHCTWKIHAPSKGLAFAFQTKPDMACSKADTCYDFLEIRTNMTHLSSPGQFYCTCGESKTRFQVDQNTAIIRWASTTLTERSGAGVNTGFILNIYATCGDSLGSQLMNSCTVSTTGYDSCSDVSIPLCPADFVEVIEPPKAVN